MACVCGSFLRRNGEATTGDANGGGASVMDASFVHLPPSLLVNSEDRGTDKSALQHHRVHPLHMEYLERIVNQTSATSELCLYCVQRYGKNFIFRNEM